MIKICSYEMMYKFKESIIIKIWFRIISIAKAKMHYLLLKEVSSAEKSGKLF